MIDIDKDIERLAGKFRALETSIRMFKERQDNVKHAEKKFHKILKLLNENDGFTVEEINMLETANKISGSIGHGNFSELMDKMDKYVLKQYFPSAIVSRNTVSRIHIVPESSVEDLVKAITTEIHPVASSDCDADIFEAYLVAKSGGYLHLAEIFADEVHRHFKTKLFPGAPT